MRGDNDRQHILARPAGILQLRSGIMAICALYLLSSPYCCIFTEKCLHVARGAVACSPNGRKAP
jgi:hypothetical protein